MHFQTCASGKCDPQPEGESGWLRNDEHDGLVNRDVKASVRKVLDMFWEQNDRWQNKGELENRKAEAPCLKIRFLKYNSIGWGRGVTQMWSYEGWAPGTALLEAGCTLPVNGWVQRSSASPLWSHRLFPELSSLATRLLDLSSPLPVRHATGSPAPSSCLFSASPQYIASTFPLSSVSLKIQMNTMEQQHIS